MEAFKSIFLHYELWQYTSFEIQIAVINRILAVIQQKQVIEYFIHHNFIEYFFYLLSYQLSEDYRTDQNLTSLNQLRHLILQLIKTIITQQPYHLNFF